MDIRTPKLFCACLMAAAIVAPGTAPATREAAEDLVFKVMLDDQEIGVHRFNVDRRQERELVEIRADFDVTFLAIPVYSYDHQNREVWRGGCLERIDSKTDDNGDQFRVEGEDRGERFVVATQDGTIELDADCVMSFAYWNREFLTQGRLLNAQTGEYLPVSVEELGSDRLRLGNDAVEAKGYRLLNRDEDLDISVWYAADSGRWLSLQSKLGGERTLRYLPLDDAAAEKALERLASSATPAPATPKFGDKR